MTKPTKQVCAMHSDQTCAMPTVRLQPGHALCFLSCCGSFIFLLAIDR